MATMKPLAILLLACSCSLLRPTPKAEKPRGPASVDLEEIRKGVVVSDKSFWKMTNPGFGVSVRVLDYSQYHTVPKALRQVYRFRDELHGVYMKALCGSYEATKKMAIRKNAQDWLTGVFTKRLLSPYQLIVQCKDGRVLVYSSPRRINFWDVIDPDWDYEG